MITINTIIKRSESRHTAPLFVFLLVLAFGHSIQLVGPLRLNRDAITVLSMALSGAEGNGFLEDGAPAVISSGYPWLLSNLLRVGLVSSVNLVALNLFFVAVGLLCLFYALLPKLGLNRKQSLLIVCMTLSSWVVIKHAPIPLTDIPFFAISLLSLTLMDKARSSCSNQAAIGWFILSWIAILAAIGTRRIGIALLPALIWAIASRWNSFFLSWRVKEWFVSLMLVLGAAAFTLAWIASLVTLGGSPSVGSIGGGIKLLFDNIKLRAFEFGELGLNVTHTKAPLWLQPLFVPVGAAALAVMASGMFVKKVLEPIDVYLIFYFVIMLGWPYSDFRFSIPVIPIVLTYWMIWFNHKGRTWCRWCVVCFLCWYLFAGLGAIVYSGRISLSGDQFPDRFGDGTLRSTYCTFLEACGGKVMRPEDNKAVDLLRVFSQRQ